MVPLLPLNSERLGFHNMGYGLVIVEKLICYVALLFIGIIVISLQCQFGLWDHHNSPR